MACKCLNVRIRPQPEHTKPPDFLIANPDYTLTYVGEHGLTIEHPQVTARTRKIGQPIPDSPRCIRYTTLTCLICKTLAYRVQQLVQLDVDGQEGPLLPSSDWVEQETLKSSHGWIEVYKDCLASNAIAALSSSSDFSPVFHMAVPQRAAPSPDEPASEESPDSPDHSQYDIPSGPFLSNLKPLFPPAPFIPLHPVFSHLLSIAESHCEKLRADAETNIAAIIREKVAELQLAEDKLRRDVKCLWKQFIENVDKVQKETGVIAKKAQGGSYGHPPNPASVPGTPLVSVRNFVPVVSPTERVRSPISSIPRRMSSLSASLATSGFYHPAAQKAQPVTTQSPDAESPPSSSPYSSHTSSSLSSLSGRSPPTELDSPGPSPRTSRDTIIQPFRRKMDEQQDTAVSFRYFTIVEAEAAHKRQQQPAAAQVAVEHKRTVEKPAATSGDRREWKSPGDNQMSTTERHATEERPKKPDEESKAPPEVTTTPKSKRRVTFDIKVETNDANEKSNKTSPVEKSWEMIFDLEDEVESGEREVPEATQVPWIVDNTPTSPRSEHNRSGSRDALLTPTSFRATSLPVRSIPLVRTNGNTGGRLVHANGLPDAIVPLSPSEEQKTEQSDDVDPEEEDMLKLVAAHTPSHRNAWRRHSKAWNALVGSSYLKGVPGAFMPKENEDDSERTQNETDDSDLDSSQDVRWSFQAGIPASLPINIRPLVRRREPLSLASYQPKTSLPEKAGAMVPPLPDAPGGRHVPPVLSHAERDQKARFDTRSCFTARIEEDEEGSDDEPAQIGIPDEARGRQRALKILKARSKIPAAGMWRSLA
ncbi:hypothetical protein EDC04DRAFT_2867609 [Pisolithus marmoratus]|nr:hypothetical protein EDC04DRAFT_2867609 [Pisolithus marmoratus]